MQLSENSASMRVNMRSLESMIARTEYSLLYLTLLFAAITLLAIILLIWLISSARFKKYSDSFFTICAVGFIFNAISLVNLNVGGTVASLGWLPASYTQTNATVQVFFFFTYFSRCGEVITTVLIALNRMTAIFLPFRHMQIWSRRTQFFCFFYQFLMGTVMGVIVVVTSYSSWVQASDGASFPKLQQSESSALLIYVILVVSVGFIAVVFLLYVFSYCKLRKTLRNESLNDQQQSKSERSLSYLATLTCLVEVAYYLVFAYVFVIAKDFENHPLGFHLILSIQGNLNSGIHPYLLIMFSSIVRKALKKQTYNTRTTSEAVSTIRARTVTDVASR